MDENVETPLTEDLWRAQRPFLPSQTEHEWRLEVVVLLRGIFECLAHAPWMQFETEEPTARHETAAAGCEVSVKAEPGAVRLETPETEEPLPTWILTDEAVSRVEEAIEQEQRVRGRAYGG